MFGWTAKSFKNSFETFRPGLRCSRGTPRGWYFLSSVCVCSGAYCLTLVLMLACRMGSPFAFALQVCVTFLFTFPCPRRTISVLQNGIPVRVRVASLRHLFVYVSVSPPNKLCTLQAYILAYTPTCVQRGRGRGRGGGRGCRTFYPEGTSGFHLWFTCTLGLLHPADTWVTPLGY